MITLGITALIADEKVKLFEENESIVLVIGVASDLNLISQFILMILS